jgi:hypothetical protein
MTPQRHFMKFLEVILCVNRPTSIYAWNFPAHLFLSLHSGGASDRRSRMPRLALFAEGKSFEDFEPGVPQVLLVLAMLDVVNVPRGTKLDVVELAGRLRVVIVAKVMLSDEDGAKNEENGNADTVITDVLVLCDPWEPLTDELRVAVLGWTPCDAEFGV